MSAHVHERLPLPLVSSAPPRGTRETEDVAIDASTVPPFSTTKHAAYIAFWAAGKEPYEYEMAEYLRMSGVYWCLTAMDMKER